MSDNEAITKCVGVGILAVLLVFLNIGSCAKRDLEMIHELRMKRLEVQSGHCVDAPTGGNEEAIRGNSRTQ